MGGGELQHLEVAQIRRRVVGFAQTVVSLAEDHGGKELLPIDVATERAGFAHEPGDDVAVVDLGPWPLQPWDAIDLAALVGEANLALGYVGVDLQADEVRRNRIVSVASPARWSALETRNGDLLALGITVRRQRPEAGDRLGKPGGAQRVGAGAHLVDESLVSGVHRESPANRGWPGASSIRRMRCRWAVSTSPCSLGQPILIVCGSTFRCRQNAA